MIDVDPLKTVMRVQSFVQAYSNVPPGDGHIKLLSPVSSHVRQALE